MDAVITISDVRTFETNRGNTRYVVRDTEGNEYTTFREAIGQRAQQLEGRRVRIARPPKGQDFNDMLRGRAPRREEDAA